MDKDTRNRIQRATQAARRLLELEYREQLEGSFDILLDGTVAAQPGSHLTAPERVLREKLVAAVAHKRAGGSSAPEAVAAYLREASFTTLNRFVALKMLEARSLVQQCVSKGDESGGFKEFTALAPALASLPDRGYRLYIETIFDEIGQEVRVLFDRRDVASLLWPRRQALHDLLALLNDPELGSIWAEDETIGWVYQYFNGDDERAKMRDPKQGGSQAPRNSRELAVRNQFFTPRYVVEFLVDNTLGRTWYEMRAGQTSLRERCSYFVPRPKEVLLHAEFIDLGRCHPGVRKALFEGDFAALPTEPSLEDWSAVALAIRGYDEAPRHGLGECAGLANARSDEYRRTGRWRGTALELWCCLFFEQRAAHHCGDAPELGAGSLARELYLALRQRLADGPRDEEERKSWPTFVPVRPMKDPRELRVLDPACGSGHFLLYSFDLLLTIYEEAWHADLDLQKDYPELEKLQRALPALILEHNLHGVDIDPRAAQIAALALWLRAQRAWKEFGIPAAARPEIRRTHIVVAEPMPGDAGLVEEFAPTLDPPLLRDLFRKMVGEMRLAGELGSLIPIERAIAEELHRARVQFVARQRELDKGYLPGFEPVRRQGDLDLSGIDDDGFFIEAESRIVEALRKYAEAATNGKSVRRRLFAGDAAQGIALIELMRKRFDIVLMNPPFGSASVGAKKQFEQTYSRSKNDICAAFIECGVHILISNGFLGAITSRTGFFLSSFQKWREEFLLKRAPPLLFADLGQGVLDGAMVEVAASVLQATTVEPDNVSLTAFRLLYEEDKSIALTSAVNYIRTRTRGQYIFIVSFDEIKSIPGCPLAYWMTPGIRKIFRNFQAFDNESLGRSTRCGLGTLDDFRFLRLNWETAPGSQWVTYYNGGIFSPFYDQITLLVNWGIRGEELKTFVEQKVGSASRKVQGEDHYFAEGFYFPRRTKALSPKVMPTGGIFSTGGQAGFTPRDELLATISLLSSRICSFLISVAQGRTGDAAQFEVGLIKRIPWPLEQIDMGKLGNLARHAWSLKRRLDSTNETSLAFLVPQTMERKIGLDRAAINGEIIEIQDEIEQIAFSLYQLKTEDKAAIDATTTGDQMMIGGDTEDHNMEEEDEEEEAREDLEALAPSGTTISWLLGVAFGRFERRLATGERPVPPEPEPFDPLPARSPGMWPEGEERYVLPPGHRGFLVDDPGTQHDITAHVANLAAQTGWPDPDDLRQWFARDFFPLHLKMYSKSRRKAPIYWQLATPSASYSVWLYAHRVTPDTFFMLSNEVVGPKLAHEVQRLTSLNQTAGASPGAQQRKEIAAQEAFVEELRAFLGEIKRVAPLWNPDLDDGIVLVMAPLWRLVPQHKPWQKELKTKWDELAAGQYDWAHLAMHLWPERVVPKCVADRSLAIAHGLEEVFWAEDADGKWRPRRVAPDEVQRLVKERTSPAVKAALADLLDAPAPVTGSTRRASPRIPKPEKSATPASSPSRSPRAEVDGGTLDRVRQAIAAVAGGASKADILAATGLADGEWSRAIGALLERGEVAKTGEKRGTRYHVAREGGGEHA